jgi:Zn-dependent M28 family amino/carboxypeptidase
MNKTRTTLLLVGCLALFLDNSVVTAGPLGCDSRANNTIAKLQECVTVESVRQHQAAFQDIADANGGTRASGTSGYDASADYIAQAVEVAGYDVTVQDFSFPFFTELQPAELQQIAPVPTVYPYFDATGFATMDYSGSGDVTAIAEGVDIINPTGQPANTSTSGCEASDFAAFTAGNIAVLQRGTCSFALKVQNAEAAGAVGVIIFNEGQPGRTDAFLGTLGGPFSMTPVVGAAYDVGLELAAGGVTVRMFVNAISETRNSSNVIAETLGGASDNVVMIGAHLDSVTDGPGIQDNGSGSSAILEVALQMKNVKPRNKLRFAWWGAGEAGQVGSNFYVENLTVQEIGNIALYLDFHMLASPNFVYFILDGDDSDAVGGAAGPVGSAEIEAFFERYYGGLGLPYKGTDLIGTSDYSAFMSAGVPVGGLFTGDVGLKTTEEVAFWGGTAGEQYDPCYHLACDTFDNVSLEALDVNTGAVAAATLQYAMSTEEVNGEKGKGNFNLPQVAGPVGPAIAE